MRNKQYHEKVLLNRFQLNGNTLGFQLTHFLNRGEYFFICAFILFQLLWRSRGKPLMSCCVVPIQKRLAANTTNVVSRRTKSAAHRLPQCPLTAVQRISQYAKMDNATEHVTATWSEGSPPLEASHCRERAERTSDLACVYPPPLFLIFWGEEANAHGLLVSKATKDCLFDIFLPFV